LRNLFFLLFFLVSFKISFSQVGQWTWMNGSNTLNSARHSGTEDVFDSLNTPLGLYEACEWTDKQGNFWLYGGVDHLYGINGFLWKFNPLISQWAYMGFAGVDEPGNYGIQGIESPANDPGCRGYGAMTWVDTSGNLWLFGGEAFDANLNVGGKSDLWKYNLSNGEWTWMKGPYLVSDLGFYGIKGFASPSNNPKSRTECSITWSDADNNLWLYGGEFNSGFLNDLWKYNVNTNEWTWVKGDSTVNHAPLYGAQGISDTSNSPGSRVCYSKWQSFNGDLWLFGGENHLGALNDLWKYNIQTNSWTWIDGDTIVNDTTTLINGQCFSSIDNMPHSRFENRACWILGCDNFDFFGGWGVYNNNSFNDIWNYSVITNSWSLINGTVLSNQIPYYGSKNVSNALNNPGGRAGSVGWRDNSGNLWLFGGAIDSNSFCTHNDMWRFVLDPCCPNLCGNNINVQSSFSAIPLSGCNTLAVTFINNSINGNTFLWDFGDGDTSTSYAPTHIYTTSGIFDISLIALSTCGGNTDTSILTITVYQDYNNSVSDTICQGNIYHFPDGTIITAIADTIQISHLTTINSCDSSIVTTLTVNPPYSQTLSASICQSNIFTFPDGSMINAVFDTIQTSHFLSINSCDSNIVTTLTVNPKYNVNDSVTICIGETFTFPDGTTAITDTVQNSLLLTVNGCDSVIVTSLTVIDVDTSVTISIPTFISNATIATYQWIDCANGNIAIAGATNQSYSAIANGSYAVIVTQNGCTDTSSCYDIFSVGIDGIFNQNDIVIIYPNPTSGSFTLSYSLPQTSSTNETQLQITDVFGRMVYTQSITNPNQTIIDVSQLSDGVYFYEVRSGLQIPTSNSTSSLTSNSTSSLTGNSTGSLTGMRGKFVKEK